MQVSIEEMTEVKRKEKFYTRHGVPVQVLDGAAVAKAEPNLRPGLAGGLRVPDDAVLYPPCAAALLLHQAQHGILLLQGGLLGAQALLGGTFDLRQLIHETTPVKARSQTG